MSGVEVEHIDGDGLRERRSEKQDGHLNGNAGAGLEGNKEEKTFGRTPDGTGE